MQACLGTRLFDEFPRLVHGDVFINAVGLCHHLAQCAGVIARFVQNREWRECLFELLQQGDAVSRYLT